MRIPFIILLALAGCTESEKITQDIENQPVEAASPDDSSDMAPSDRPVRIGELGPRFQACTGSGRVIGQGAPLLAAPFEDGREVGTLPAGATIYLCNRSFDQDWIGVVVPGTIVAELPTDTPALDDCGVRVTVRHPRAYDGPCQSGWVESAKVRLVASEENAVPTSGDRN